MVDWKLYIDSPQKRALHSCYGSRDEDDGYGDGVGNGYGWSDGDGCGEGYDEGDGYGFCYGWVNDSDGVSSNRW